jgi:hypothetical protein
MPDCARCSHPHEIHQHYRSNMTDDCAVLGLRLPHLQGSSRPVRRWLERWLR